MTKHDVPAEVTEQIDALVLEPDRPLIISDADEVLFAFVAALERFLESQGFFLRLESFALTGNIRERETGEKIEAGKVRDLIHAFFDDHTEDMDPVEGAADALAALSEKSQIVVLSNVPLDRRDARQRALRRHGMDFPLIANIGRKGGAVAHLTRSLLAPAYFLDDIPHNIASVAEAAADVVCLHFVADRRLARLLDKAEHAHVRTDDWATARSFIEQHLNQQGY
jgi:phosphoglycolate phosphatase-like HAD superfamily hydrolase